MNRSRSLIIVLTLLISLLTAGAAAAAPGDIDRSFGNNGRAAISFGTPSSAISAVAQANGSVVVAGTVEVASERVGFLSRLTPQGHLDKTFGVDGTLKLGAASSLRIVATPGGTIYALSKKLGQPPVIYAITSNGELNSLFGVAGKLDTAMTFPAYAADAIAAQGENLLVSSVDRNEFQATPTGMLTRWTPTGVLDPSFGTAGEVMTHPMSFHANTSLAVLDDGSFVAVAGTLAKYSKDGVVDNAFHVTGNLAKGVMAQYNDTLELAAESGGGFAAVMTQYLWGRGLTIMHTAYRFNGDGSEARGSAVTVLGGTPVPLSGGSLFVVGDSNTRENRLEASLLRPGAPGWFDIRQTGDRALRGAGAAALPNGDVVVVGTGCSSNCAASAVKILTRASSRNPKYSPGLRRPQSVAYTAGTVRRIEGTVRPRKGLKSVSVALLRTNIADFVTGRCPWFKKARSSFVNRSAAGNGPCGSPRFIRASGRARWHLTLGKGLANGQYEVYVSGNWRGRKPDPLSYDAGGFARFTVGF